MALSLKPKEDKFYLSSTYLHIIKFACIWTKGIICVAPDSNIYLLYRELLFQTPSQLTVSQAMADKDVVDCQLTKF